MERGVEAEHVVAVIAAVTQEKLIVTVSPVARGALHLLYFTELGRKGTHTESLEERTCTCTCTYMYVRSGWLPPPCVHAPCFTP